MYLLQPCSEALKLKVPRRPYFYSETKNHIIFTSNILAQVGQARNVPHILKYLLIQTHDDKTIKHSSQYCTLTLESLCPTGR